MSAEKPKPPPASGLAEPFFLAIRKSQIQKHENFLLGAFAELIDNASEALATTLKIDIDHEQTGALFFLDNGIGMDRGTIRTLLTELNNTTKVGGTNYGVGFKTGAFNLGEEILVLSKTYECGPRCTYRKDTLEGTSSAVCACDPKDKKPVRSLGFMSKAWSVAEGEKNAPCQGCMCRVDKEGNKQPPCKKGCGKKDDRTLKVAMVFWDREGRAITAIPEGRNLRDSLPGSDGEIGPIKVDDVEQEIKWITKYSRLHTIGAVQKYFDKIPGCGTLILLCPLPDVANSKEVVFEPNAASGERSTDIILRWDSPGYFPRNDRLGANFAPGTDLPIDWSLRAYCEILHDASAAMEGRRKMQIEIMGEKVEPHSVAAMCKRAPLKEYDFEIDGLDQRLCVGFSEELHTRKACGIFAYFDKGNDLPPRLILSLTRMRVSSVLSASNDTNHGLVAYALVRGCKPDNGKQTFGGCVDGNSAYSVSFTELQNAWSERLTEYYHDTDFKKVRDDFSQAQADLVFKNICQGGIFWAKWGMSPAWPSCVHDRWNREILRDIGAPQFFEQSRWAGGEKTFPRDAHPGNILVKCYETNELLWCKPTDLIDWNSEEGERLRRQKVPDQYKKALTAAVALADADATTGYAKDNFVAVRRCWDCNAMRNWQGIEGDQLCGDWHCDEGFLNTDGDTEHGCLADARHGKGQSGPIVSWSGAPVSDRMHGFLEQLRAKSLYLTDKIENVKPLRKQGSFGKIFTGTCRTSTYAIKVVELHNDTAKEHLYKELLAAFEIVNRHTNILNYYYVTNQQMGESKDSLGIVMELGPGFMVYLRATSSLSIGFVQMKWDLDDAAHSTEVEGVRRRPTPGEWISILAGVADAMVFLHDNTIMHRDLKPANVLLNEQNIPKICDFGTVKHIDSNNTWLKKTSTTPGVGSLAYMAPELQRQKGGPINWALADVFSFGALCVDILCPETETLSNRQREYLQNAKVHGDLEAIRNLALDCVQDDLPKRPEDFRKIIKTLQDIQSINAAKLQDTLPQDPLSDYIARHGQKDEKLKLYRVLDSGDLRVLRSKRLTELPPVNPYSAVTVDQHVAKGRMRTRFISTTCSPKWALHYLHKQFQTGGGVSYPIAVIDVRKLKKHLGGIYGSYDNVPADVKRSALYDWTVLAPGEYGVRNKIGVHFGTDAMEVTLGMPIPIDAITDFLWLGTYDKPKSRCIANFLKHVSPKPGKFSSFKDWNHLYGRLTDAGVDVEAELFQELTIFPIQNNSDMKECTQKLEYITKHIDADRIILPNHLPYQAYETNMQGHTMNLFLAGHTQMDFRNLSDPEKGFALVVGLGDDDYCNVTMDFGTVKRGDTVVQRVSNGLDYVSLPTGYFTSPSSPEKIAKCLIALTNLIIVYSKRGGKVLIHCKSGKGASAALAAVTVMRMMREAVPQQSWTFKMARDEMQKSFHTRIPQLKNDGIGAIKINIAKRLQDDIEAVDKEIRQASVPSAGDKTQVREVMFRLVESRKKVKARRLQAASGDGASGAEGGKQKEPDPAAGASGRKADGGKVPKPSASKRAHAEIAAVPLGDGKAATSGKKKKDEQGGGANRSKGDAAGGKASSPDVRRTVGGSADSDDEPLSSKKARTDDGGASNN